MGTRESDTSTRKDRAERPSSERYSKNAQWDALDHLKRSAVAGTAGGVWPLAVCVRPICQVAERWHIGSRVSRIVRRCGLNTKLHTIVDGLGNPVEFMLSAGNDHDSVHAVELLEKVEISGSNVLADRAYGAKTIRAYISEQGASYVIPPQSNVSDPWPVDWWLYKERHLVECFFQKLKWFRRVATRYDKLDASFLAFVYLASIAILLI